MSLVKYFQKASHAAHLIRVRNYIELPAFSVVFSDGTPYGHSRLAFEFTVQTTKRVMLQHPLEPPTDCNFTPVVRLPIVGSSGIPARYALWDVTGISIPLQHTEYNNERLPISFVIEIWGVDGNTTVDLSSAYRILTSSRTIRTGRATPDAADIAADNFTQNESIFSIDFPWPIGSKPSYVIDFDNPVTLP